MSEIKIVTVDKSGAVTERKEPPVKKVKAQELGLNALQIERLIRAKQPAPKPETDVE